MYIIYFLLLQALRHIRMLNLKLTVNWRRKVYIEDICQERNRSQKVKIRLINKEIYWGKLINTHKKKRNIYTTIDDYILTGKLTHAMQTYILSPVQNLIYVTHICIQIYYTYRNKDMYTYTHAITPLLSLSPIQVWLMSILSYIMYVFL